MRARRLHIDGVERLARRHEQAVALLAAEGEISAGLRQLDLADPIAIHYSQASFRTDWMLRNQPRGSAWIDRTSSSERLDNDFLRLRESYCRLIEDLGLQYRFVSYSQLEQGELSRGGYRVLILPDSLALSAAEVGAIRDFIRSGGRVIATGEPGGFDEHSRKLASPQLNDVRDQMIRIPGDVLNYHRDRLLGKEGAVLEAARKVFQAADVDPRFRVVDERGQDGVGVEIHVFRNGGATIVGLLSNPQLRVDELGPPEFRSNERFEKPRATAAAFGRRRVRIRRPERAVRRKAESRGAHARSL